jgi:hypothetical protein
MFCGLRAICFTFVADSQPSHAVAFYPLRAKNNEPKLFTAISGQSQEADQQLLVYLS